VKMMDSYASTGGSMRLVMGLAVQEIEAWLLADEEALGAAFGERYKARACNRAEDCKDPRSYWSLLRGEAASKTPADARRDGISSMRSKVVARRCPKGFKPFLACVERAFLKPMKAGGRRGP
jgi:hypothetical protein